MPAPEHRRPAAEDVQLLDNVLQDTATPDRTRRALLRRVSAGVLGAGTVGAFLGACGSDGSSSAGGGSGTAASTPTATGSSGAPSGDDVKTLLDTAATAEALAVTFLSGILARPKGKVKDLAGVLQAANASEYAHYEFLTGAGAKPIATKFWVPDALLAEPFKTLETAETLFVNAYLIAMSTFAKAGKADLARYAGEICGVEAEHLALARFARGGLPNDLAFARYDQTSIDGVVAALQGAGIGFGEQGKAPGRFYAFPGRPPASTTTTIQHVKPQ